MKSNTKFYYYFLYFLVWPVFRIIYPTKCINKHNIPEGTAIFCPNHTSLKDPLFVAFALGFPRRVHAMAKEELMGIPILGFLLGKAGIFGVNRGGADIGAIKHALKCIKNGEQLLMFPEGTRHSDGEMRDAKNGCAMLATRTGAMLVPIYIPVKRKLFRFTRVVIGEPYYPTFEGKKATSEDYRIIADDLLNRIRQLEVEYT